MADGVQAAASLSRSGCRWARSGRRRFSLSSPSTTPTRPRRLRHHTQVREGRGQEGKMQGNEAGDGAPRSPQRVPSSRASEKGDWRSPSHPSPSWGSHPSSKGTVCGREADSVSRGMPWGYLLWIALLLVCSRQHVRLHEPEEKGIEKDDTRQRTHDPFPIRAACRVAA